MIEIHLKVKIYGLVYVSSQWVQTVNGMARHGGLHPYGATFFVFSDYLKPALRLSAIMGLNSTFIFTHDSIAVGEDGPTHEPIEQLAGLRSIPNMNVIRPVDGNETRVAWEVALESEQTPTSLVLTRQNLPYLDVDEETVEQGVRKVLMLFSKLKLNLSIYYLLLVQKLA